MQNKNFKEFLKLDANMKTVLLKALDFNIDINGYILDTMGKKIICPYSKTPVKFDTVSILPGSTILINTSLITLSEYISDYLEIDEGILNEWYQ